MADACRVVGPEIAIWGNLDPVGLLVQSTPADVRRKTEDLICAMRRMGHRRFVASSGCTLAPDTPEANLRALIETAQGFAIDQKEVMP
jgi:uroporphyrinogen-III decarboxylase